MNKTIKEWEEVTDKLATAFRDKYFDKDADSWWIGDEIGGVYYINDYFFDFDTMKDFLKYKYSEENMLSYYNYALHYESKVAKPINIKNYIKLES